MAVSGPHGALKVILFNNLVWKLNDLTFLIPLTIVFVETIYCVLHLDKTPFEDILSRLSLNIPQRPFLKPPFFIKLVYFIYSRCNCNKNPSCFKYPIKWHVYVFLKLVQSLGDWLVSVKMFIVPSSVKCCSFSDLWECWIRFQQTLSPPNVPVFGIRNSFQTPVRKPPWWDS